MPLPQKPVVDGDIRFARSSMNKGPVTIADEEDEPHIF